MASTGRVVCFDLGGVLVRICRSWDEACTHARLPFRAPERMATEEARLRRWSTVDRYQRGALAPAAFFEELSQATDGLYSRAEVELIHQAWTLREYPGALELVQELNRKACVVTACLSNTNCAHWRRLAGEDGRAEYPSVLELRHRLASHLLGCAKPDAHIYALAQAEFAARLGPPEEVIFFDDLRDNVLAARAAGWTAFPIDPVGDTAAQMREHLASAGLALAGS